MHEMSIAQGLIDILHEEMSKYRAERLRRVKVRIGELSGVVPEALSFCFNVIVEGTELDGARLELERVPLEGRCRACGACFRIRNYAFQCPECGDASIEIVSGRELSIVEMEVDEEGGNE
ncbi:putative hydrogenase nickel incorporation protein HypA 2 [uncultured Desulfatiglans sp.]|uniref:Hydrogenase maturation factor HypA n=1 Tax=Uncultured Desulfatiglans sp. TaxID=1748965 RepID=A0A653A707_UNCDX|nr:putative hydrogenase nickel incorporation protein HypA 2 [uncultured Desulfatiglans sp.]